MQPLCSYFLFWFGPCIQGGGPLFSPCEPHLGIKGNSMPIPCPGGWGRQAANGPPFQCPLWKSLTKSERRKSNTLGFVGRVISLRDFDHTQASDVIGNRWQHAGAWGAWVLLPGASPAGQSLSCPGALASLQGFPCEGPPPAPGDLCGRLWHYYRGAGCWGGRKAGGLVPALSRAWGCLAWDGAPVPLGILPKNGQGSTSSQGPQFLSLSTSVLWGKFLCFWNSGDLGASSLMKSGSSMWESEDSMLLGLCSARDYLDYPLVIEGFLGPFLMIPKTTPGLFRKSWVSVWNLLGVSCLQDMCS